MWLVDIVKVFKLQRQCLDCSFWREGSNETNLCISISPLPVKLSLPSSFQSSVWAEGCEQRRWENFGDAGMERGKWMSACMKLKEANRKNITQLPTQRCPPFAHPYFWINCAFQVLVFGGRQLPPLTHFNNYSHFSFSSSFFLHFSVILSFGGLILWHFFVFIICVLCCAGGRSPQLQMSQQFAGRTRATTEKEEAEERTEECRRWWRGKVCGLTFTCWLWFRLLVVCLSTADAVC